MNCFKFLSAKTPAAASTAALMLLIILAASRADAAEFIPTRFTMVDGGTVGKPDVLLIPGLTSGREVWTAEATKLDPSYRLHLLQINGFAGQPPGPNAVVETLLPAVVDELHEYIAARQMHPMVISHSLGGLLTLMLADKHPGDVSKIVIVDAMPFFGLMFGPQATLESVQPAAKAMRAGMEQPQTQTQREAAAKQTAQTLTLDPEGRKLVEAESLASDPHVAGQAMYEDLQTDLRPRLPNIEAKTLVLYAFDPTLTFPNGVKPTQEMADNVCKEAYRSMPNVRTVRVDGSRHFIMFDQPQKFDELVQTFLRDGD